MRKTKKQISKCGFRDAFRDAGRRDQFTYDGLGALFDWLEELEQDMDDEIELDVIALCCDFSEYDSVQECGEEYGLEGDDEEILEQLQNNTTVINVEGGGIIIQSY
jgi:hypothetical protein